MSQVGRARRGASWAARRGAPRSELDGALAQNSLLEKRGKGRGRGTRGGKRARDNKNRIGAFRELENVERPLEMLQEKYNTTIKARASY